MSPDRDALLGMAWFNALTELERAQWLHRAQSAVPAEAWAFFKQSQPDKEVTGPNTVTK